MFVLSRVRLCTLVSHARPSYSNLHQSAPSVLFFFEEVGGGFERFFCLCVAALLWVIIVYVITNLSYVGVCAQSRTSLYARLARTPLLLQSAPICAVSLVFFFFEEVGGGFERFFCFSVVALLWVIIVYVITN